MKKCDGKMKKGKPIVVIAIEAKPKKAKAKK
jgi:hypothetical protein